jgi:hypothetical protein
VHRAEGVWTLLAQRPLASRYHRLYQLKRFLPSAGLAVLKGESVYRAEDVGMLLA